VNRCHILSVHYNPAIPKSKTPQGHNWTRSRLCLVLTVAITTALMSLAVCAAAFGTSMPFHTRDEATDRQQKNTSSPAQDYADLRDDLQRQHADLRDDLQRQHADLTDDLQRQHADLTDDLQRQHADLRDDLQRQQKNNSELGSPLVRDCADLRDDLKWRYNKGVKERRIH
jgi:hypothetical protein